MKYIIEFEDEPYMREDGVDYYTCKSARWYKLGETIINRLTPYTEPDLSPLVDEAVETIENEVWDFVRIMSRKMDTSKREKCFGKGLTLEVVNAMTYQEAKGKYESWLRNGEIYVGDEVLDAVTDKGIVTYVEWGTCDVLWDDGSVTEDVKKEELHKTGRHFPGVEELLKKMRGE